MKSAGGVEATVALARIAAFPRSTSRHTRHNAAPCLANSSPVANPIPAFAPVMTTTFPSAIKPPCICATPVNSAHIHARVNPNVTQAMAAANQSLRAHQRFCGPALAGPRRPGRHRGRGPRDLIHLVLGQSLRVTMIGVLSGAAAGLAVSRLLSQLFRVYERDRCVNSALSLAENLRANTDR